MVRPRRQTRARAASAFAANDNAPQGKAGVTDAGLYLIAPSITPAELSALQPLIKALALMAANDLSATTLCSEDR